MGGQELGQPIDVIIIPLFPTIGPKVKQRASDQAVSRGNEARGISNSGNKELRKSISEFSYIRF